MDDSSTNGLAPRFSLRTLLELIAVVAFVLFLFYGRERDGAGTGRYQLFSGPWGIGSDREATYLLDTQTGDCWVANGEPWPKVDRQMPAPAGEQQSK